MIEQKYGRIINLGSQAGFVALPTESIYCMTKAVVVYLASPAASLVTGSTLLIDGGWTAR